MALCESRVHREQDEESPFEVVIHAGEEELGPFMPRDFAEAVFVWLSSEFPLPNAEVCRVGSAKNSNETTP